MYTLDRRDGLLSLTMNHVSISKILLTKAPHTTLLISCSYDKDFDDAVN